MTEDQTERIKYHIPLLFSEVPVTRNGLLPMRVALDTKNRCIDHMIYLLNQQRAYNSRIRNASYPAISRLPPELHLYIFLDAVAEEASLKPASSARTVVPLRLTHVCYSWRILALGLSEIWASVHCRVRKGKVLEQTALLQEWISRSKGRLLSIRISFEDETVWNDSQSTTMIKALIPHSQRWRNLDLVVPKTWVPVLKTASNMVDNLESVKLRALPNSYSSSPLPTLFGIAPKLRKIYLKSLGLVLPWSNITSATLHGLAMSQVYTFLDYWPTLISGSFLELRENGIHELAADPRPHHTLERLSLSFPETLPILIDNLLEGLVLPKLRHLTLSLSKRHPPPGPSLEALIARSGCPIKTIEIAGPMLGEDETFDLLQCSKGLVHVNNHTHPFIMLNNEDD